MSSQEKKKKSVESALSALFNSQPMVSFVRGMVCFAYINIYINILSISSHIHTKCLCKLSYVSIKKMFS